MFGYSVMCRWPAFQILLHPPKCKVDRDERFPKCESNVKEIRNQVQNLLCCLEQSTWAVAWFLLLGEAGWRWLAQLPRSHSSLGLFLASASEPSSTAVAREATCVPRGAWCLWEESSHVPIVCSWFASLMSRVAPAGDSWCRAGVWKYWLGVHRSQTPALSHTTISDIPGLRMWAFRPSSRPTDEQTLGPHGPGEGSSVGKECLPRAVAPSEDWNKKKLLFRANGDKSTVGAGQGH